MSSVDVVVITVEEVDSRRCCLSHFPHSRRSHQRLQSSSRCPGLEDLEGEVDGFHVIHLGPNRGVGRPSRPGYLRGYHHNMLKAVRYNMCKNTVFDFIRSELMLRKNPNHLDRHFGKGRFKILSMQKILSLLTGRL